MASTMDIDLQFLLLTSYEFLLYQLHIETTGQRQWKSFCGIAIKHHVPR